jgi:hypothetical protein
MTAKTVQKAPKKCVDTDKRLCELMGSIPAKPLVQAKLKCGGFFIALMPAGRLA